MLAIMAFPPFLDPERDAVKPPLFSPKLMELKASLGTPMVKAAPIRPQFVPNGFMLTNISVVNGQASLFWQPGTAVPPWQVYGSPTLSGPWNSVGNNLLPTTKTFPVGQNQFWRVQSGITNSFTANSTNQPRLNWTAPDTDMSDSLGKFLIEKSTVAPPGTDSWSAVSGHDAGEAAGTYLSTTRQANDATTPFVKYRITQTTANGVVIPYQMPSLNGSPQTPGVVNWVRQMKQVGAQFRSIFPAAVKKAPDGGTVVVGSFKGTADFGTPGVPGSAPSTPLVASDSDLFLVKYNSTGAHQWSFRYGSTGTEGPFQGALAMGANGDIAVCGSYTGLGNAGGSNFPVAPGTGAAFVAKYNSLGVHQWSYAYATVEGPALFASVAINSSGNVIVGGSLTCSGAHPINFGTPGHPGTNLYTLYVTRSPVMVGFDSVGNYLWSWILEVSFPSTISGIAVEPITDYICWAAQLGFGGVLVGDVVINGPSAILNLALARIGPLGQLPPYANTWAVAYGSNVQHVNTSQFPYALTLDSNNDLITSGSFAFELNLGNGVFLEQRAESAGWIGKHSHVNGGFLAQHTFPSTVPANTLKVLSVATDSANNVYAAGIVTGVFDFGNGNSSQNWPSDSGFLMKLNSQLQTTWVDFFIATRDSSSGLILPCNVNGVSINEINQPIGVGYFGYTMQFPPLSLTANIPGSEDGFLLNALP